MTGAENVSVSDESFVLAARSGDDGAMAALIVRMAPVVKARVAGVRNAAGFRHSGAETDDLTQEGMIGLLSAVRSFDPARGVMFRTYASACISNRIISAVRKSARETPVTGEPLSIDGTGDPRDLSADPESIVIGRDEANRLIRILDERLSELERSVMYAYLSGGSYRKIADELSLTPKDVDNALQRIRKKLRKVH